MTPKSTTAVSIEQQWHRFIEHLNKTMPLGKDEKHLSFIGSIEKYKKIFLEANKQFLNSEAE
jgi:hypothetical protein